MGINAKAETNGLSFARVSTPEDGDILEVTEDGNDDEAWYISKADAVDIGRWLVSEFGENLLGAN